MGTGLRLMFLTNINTKWVVDQKSNECKSLKHNHPETEVGIENAEDFLSLIKKWKKLCDSFSLIGNEALNQEDDDSQEEQSDSDDGPDDSQVYEVEKVLAICYGKPNGSKEMGLHFKVVELSFQNLGSHTSSSTWENEERNHFFYSRSACDKS